MANLWEILMQDENKTFILSSFLTSQTLNYWGLLFCIFMIKNNILSLYH